MAVFSSVTKSGIWIGLPESSSSASSRGVIVDWLGKGRHLEVELHPRIEKTEMVLISGRQWITRGPLRLRPNAVTRATPFV